MRNIVRSQHPPKDVTFSMACSNQPSIPSVPASTPYTGKHGFDISFQKQKKETKSATWTIRDGEYFQYSQELKKLYVRMRSPCPIRFKTHGTPPRGCLIRAMPLYIKPEHIQEVVKRCPNHASKVDDFSFTGELVASDHLLWCENKESQYVEDVYTGRLSVVFPHEMPQAGTEWVTNLFQFACFSSCVGGLNRRPLQVVFTLEHGSEVLGRQAVEVRICACPGRDRRTEEKSELEEVPVQGKQLNLARNNKSFSSGNKRSRSDDLDVSNLESKKTFDGKKQGDEDVFTIKVCGRQNFEMLKRIRDALEFSDLIQPEHKSLILQQLTEDEQEVPLANNSHGIFLAPNNDHHHHHHHLHGYASAYVINDINKMASIDQPHTENEVSSTGINLQLVDILTPSSLSALLPSTPYTCLPSTRSNDDDDEDNGEGGDDNDVERKTNISNWLESMNMGLYADEFRRCNIFRIYDLEKLTSEELHGMSIPAQHKDTICKEMLEIKNTKSSSSSSSSGKIVLTNQRQMLAPITEFQHRPPPLPPLNNSNNIVTFSDNNHKLQAQQQQLIQLQQIIVNAHQMHTNNNINSNKIELLTPIYYKSPLNNINNNIIINTTTTNNNDLLRLNERNDNYCNDS